MDFLDKTDIKLLVLLLRGGGSGQCKDLVTLRDLAGRLQQIGLGEAIGVEVREEKTISVPISEVLEKGFVEGYVDISNPPRISLLARAKVEAFLKAYLLEYEKGTLVNEGSYDSFQRGIAQLPGLWGGLYDSCGGRGCVRITGVNL